MTRPELEELKWTRSMTRVEELNKDREAECGNNVPKDEVPTTVAVSSGQIEETVEPKQGSPNPTLDEEEISCGYNPGVSKAQEKEQYEQEEAASKGFDRFKLPSKDELKAAKVCMLSNEHGTQIPFESMVKERGKVVVVFLRHLWCGICAQYVVALKSASENLAHASTSHVSSADSASYAAPPVYILLISSGSPSLIPIYQQRLGCPFPLVVDKGRKLYKALGMTLKTLSMGKEEEKGSYITKRKAQNVVDSTLNGLAMRRYPGSQKQLGGEFVMVWNETTQELECTYASRMNTTRTHSEVRDLFAAAGVHLGAADELSVFGESLHEA